VPAGAEFGSGQRQSKEPLEAAVTEPVVADLGAELFLQFPRKARQFRRPVERVPPVGEQLGSIGLDRRQVALVDLALVWMIVGAIDGCLVDPVKFAPQVFGNVIERGQKVSHPLRQDLHERRQLASLAVGVFVSQFAPAVLQQRPDLQLTGDRRGFEHQPEVDVPTAIARLLRRLDVVPFGRLID
jgi:hypothetical protein